MMPLGSKLFDSRPVGPKLEHKNKERKFQNSFSMKLEGLELWYLVCSISLWTEVKTGPAPGSQVGIQEQRKKTSKFFFETGRHRPLIFGI